MLAKKYFSVVLGFLLFAVSCVEPYPPPGGSDNVDYLVIDAFLDAAEQACQVRISRAVSLSSETGLEELVDDAGNPIQVALVDNSGNTFFLPKVETGRYEGINLNINPQSRYRIVVNVPGDAEYTSELVAVKQTPPIEKVFFEPGQEALRILVNSTGNSEGGSYYRWKFEETFEYTPTYPSHYMIKGDSVAPRLPEEEIYVCYKTQTSDKILLASSTDLTSDAIRNFEITTIPRNSQKLQRRYSILVKQYALDEEAYTYWYNIYKTNENLGGLFDPMPGEVRGNFVNTKDPSDVVIGFFSASTVEEQRIFIAPGDLPEGYRTFRSPSCELDTVLLEDVTSQTAGRLIVSQVSASQTGPPVVIGYTVTNPSCADCRKTLKGEPIKPSFWP